MRYLIFLSLILSSFISCKKQSTIDLTNLNGYWEIDRVVISDKSQQQGQDPEKNYNFNKSIEYFSTKDSLGFRTKVVPSFNGKYETNNQKLNYTISHQKGIYYITYKNIGNTWKDKLIEASENQICIANQRGDKYIYRKFTPIIIDEKK